MQTLTKYNPNAVAEVNAPASWEQVKYWADVAGKFQQASLAAQVMAGFALAELRKIHGTNQGKRRDLTSPNDSEKLDWPDLVAKEAGISDDTARNWINMAEGIKSRWKTLSPQARLRELMSVPVADWTVEDTKVVSDALYKVTDGSTQLEFMRELGLAKAKSGNPNGGAHSTGSRKLSLAEQEAKARELALEDSGHMGSWISASNKSFVLCEDHEIQVQIAFLEFALKVRHKYLNTPKAKRGEALIAEIQELVRKDSSSLV